MWQWIATAVVLVAVAVWIVWRIVSRRGRSGYNSCDSCNGCPLHDGCNKDVSDKPSPK